MTPSQIKARLREKGITQGDLCRRWKRPKVTISFLVNRKMTSRALEKRLARILGITLEELRKDNGEGTGVEAKNDGKL